MAPFSRRAALTLPAALALGDAAAPPEALHPDQALLALARRHASHERRVKLLTDLYTQAEDNGDIERCHRLQESLVRMVPYGHELDALVADIPALTREGLEAKARAALTKVEMMRDGTPHHDGALLWSLCQDVLRRPA